MESNTRHDDPDARATSATSVTDHVKEEEGRLMEPLRRQLEAEIEGLKAQVRALAKERDTLKDSSTALNLQVVAAQKALIAEKNLQLLHYRGLCSELRTQNGFLQAQLAHAEARLATRDTATAEISSLAAQRRTSQALGASALYSASPSRASIPATPVAAARGLDTSRRFTDFSCTVLTDRSQPHHPALSLPFRLTLSDGSGTWLPPLGPGGPLTPRGSVAKPDFTPGAVAPFVHRVNPSEVRVQALLEKYGHGSGSAGSEPIGSRGTSLGASAGRNDRSESPHPPPQPNPPLVAEAAATDASAGRSETGSSPVIAADKRAGDLRAPPLLPERPVATSRKRSDSPAAAARARLAELRSTLIAKGAVA